MEPDEKRAYELFSQKQNLLTDEPAFAATFSAALDQLTAGSRRARELFAGLADLTLSEERRRALGGERFPDLQGVAALLFRPLGLHPEIAADASASAPLLQRTVRLDQALSRLVFAGHLLWRGGESGELLTTAAIRAVCDAVVRQARARQGAPDTSAEARHAITSLFAEPARLEADMKDRAARERDKTARAEEPIRAEISAAEESAAIARVVEAFLEGLRRTP